MDLTHLVQSEGSWQAHLPDVSHQEGGSHRCEALVCPIGQRKLQISSLQRGL